MVEADFRVEASKSRTGIHAERRILIVFRSDGSIERILTGEEAGRGTYSRGASWRVRVRLDPGDIAVYVRLVRGPRGRITGWAEVYDHTGRMVFRAVIRRRKARASLGDPNYGGYVERALEALGLGDFIRRYNWGTASRAHKGGS